MSEVHSESEKKLSDALYTQGNELEFQQEEYGITPDGGLDESMRNESNFTK